MAIQYEISWWDSETAQTAREYKKLFRSDAAENAIYNMARDMVASWAGLDTQWGCNFMKEVLAEEIKHLPLGCYRSFKKKLPQGDVLNVFIHRV